MNKASVQPLVFFKEVWVELQKVKWPSRQEALKLTGIVILVSLSVSLFIGLFDLIFTELVKVLFP